MENEKGLIHGKLISIMKRVDPIAKARKNQQQNYTYRGIEDTYDALHYIMADEGVVMIPKVLAREVTERASKQGGLLIYTHLTVQYKFIAEDGSYNDDCIVVGEGMDSGDKSSNKAMSAAQKYALMQTFLIPTSDKGQDSEEDSPEPQGEPQEVAEARKALIDIGNVKHLENWWNKHKPDKEKDPALYAAIAGLVKQRKEDILVALKLDGKKEDGDV